MTTASVETLARLSLKVYEKPIESAVLPLIFTPDETSDTQSLPTKITSVYATAGRAIDEKRRLKLIVGTPVSKDDTKPDPDLVRIDDTLVHQAQIFSFKRVRRSNLLPPGVYATWHGKNFFISDIIERALSQQYSVILVERERVIQLHLKHRSERVHPRRQAKPIPLITPKGKNLRSLSSEDFQNITAYLTEKQHRRLTRAWEEVTVPNIARGEQPVVSPQSVRYSINCSLAHIDTGSYRSISFKTDQYCYHGRKIKDMNRDERMGLYRHLNLTETDVPLLELYLGFTTGVPTPYKEIAKIIPSHLSVDQVGSRLRHIRESCQKSNKT
jgi:hypothetical protein